MLVQKFLYDFRRPKRWEVAVFHYPGEPSQAYVKRVVGLPGESIRIVDGDVYIDGRIARKTLDEQRAMRILVYDSRYQPRDSGRFPRWVFRSGLGIPVAGHRLVADRRRASCTEPGPDAGPGDWVDLPALGPRRGGGTGRSATSTPTTAATCRPRTWSRTWASRRG